MLLLQSLMREPALALPPPLSTMSLYGPSATTLLFPTAATPAQQRLAAAGHGRRVRCRLCVAL